jgi:hypothetical protein
MGDLAVTYAPRMERAPSAGARLLLANGYAQELGPLAEEFETTAGLYADAIKQADPSMSYLLDVIENGHYRAAERVSRGTRRFVEGTKTLQGWGVRAGGLLGGLPPDTPPDETGGHAESMEG